MEVSHFAKSRCPAGAPGWHEDHVERSRSNTCWLELDAFWLA